MNASVRCFLALAVLAVGGCAGFVPPKEVKVPVAVRCEVTMPVEPVWATKSLSPDAGVFEQAKAVLAERRQRIGYEDELRSALKACADEVDIESGDESADEAADLDE